MYYIKINNILLDNKMCLIYDFYINNLIWVKFWLTCHSI